MNCGLTWNEVWTLLGFVGFSGLILGMAVSNMLNAKRDDDAFWEEEQENVKRDVLSHDFMEGRE